ncbi:hypothetical protein BAUCODRAFT_69012 [Baudoinia panamericana UAMH 10762]|uniref:CN hydrolase domain-containing protein n=1 Tax=Baudoinia panamericana (strain UAMH 10762) TaxID=717646 RepID=M2LR49_BAUPA|nr:uncharacterized protein BAUCODRAFT_69012 [Baudoinia panamericana UAMH 10762]EMC96912.1 hypothetical protein BAUCODRAFT_69012 [Baudoinia panamericana UAMH 10762]
MRIAVLQFAPTLGDVERNMQHASNLVYTSQPESIDMLVLPEMAFSGYNFPNVSAITPYLEPTTSGPTTRWAATIAKQYQCYVIVGYPEIATMSDGTTVNYNSTVTVGPSGEVLNNYRKSFLYYTDETWAIEGFRSNSTQQPFFCGDIEGLGRIGHGICMDINPYQFTAPWAAYEFANSMLAGNARLVVLSMAWLTRLAPEDLKLEPDRPDMETVAYWLERFHPFLEASGLRDEIIVVFANRCGVEGNREGDRVCYAGSSCVMRFQGGGVRMFEKARNEVAILGKAEEAVLLVDTAQPARFLLQQKGV